MYRQLGGVQTVFRGPMYQQGYGLGGYFKRFFRWIIPIAEQHLLPHIKSGAETLGKQAVQTISDIAKDSINGRNIKESSKEHFDTAINNLKEKIENKLSGKGIKRKKNKNKLVIYKKKKFNQDIFN